MNFLIKKITAFYKRLSFFQGVAITITLTSAISIATVNIPGFNIFTPGTPISASQINSNFDKLAALIDNTRSQNYMGVWDASTNAPDIEASAPNIGDYYIVNVAGSRTFTNGENLSFVIGDWVIYNGISWEKIHTTITPSQWTTNSTNIYFNTGNVGIGTSTPGAKLDVKGALRLSGATTGYVGLQSPASAGSTTYTLPSNDGTTGQVLSTNGSGILSWQTPSVSSVSSSQITDGTIADADINATAGIAATKIGSGIIDNTEFGYLDGATSNLQSQINGKQTSDPTLGALAAFNTNGIIVQTAADIFAGRTINGTTNRVSVTNGSGVSGDPVINISTALLPSPVSGDVGKFLKATAADSSSWTSLSASDVTTALGFTPINKGGDTVTSGVFTYNASAVLRTIDPVLPTDVATKQYVDGFGQWQTTSGNVYRTTGKVGIGTSTLYDNFEVEGINGTAAVIRNTDSNTSKGAILSLDNYMGSSTTVPQIVLSNSRGTVGAKAAMQSGDDLGVISSFGRFDSTASNGAGPRIVFKAETPWTSDPTTWLSSMNFLTGPNGSPMPRMTIMAGGHIGIGTTSPSYTLDVNGQIASPYTVVNTSDKNLKKNIEQIRNAVSKLSLINGVFFDWKKEEFPEINFDTRKQMGVIAQDVEKVFPMAVTKNDKGIRSVAYTMLIAPVIEAIKELESSKAEKVEVETLKMENAQMKQALCELGKKAFCR